MNSEELKSRTKKYCLDVIALVDALSKSRAALHIGHQLLRSSTSVGANYRAACRGRSKPDFISKLGIVVEEADESLYWLELLVEAGLIPKESAMASMKEANEIIAIITSSIKTAKKNMPERIGK